MEKNQKMWLWATIALVVVVFGWWFLMPKNNQVNSPEANNTNTTNIQSPQSSQDIDNADAGVAAVPIAYADALVKYADRRIQIDSGCQATPNNVTYKDGTGIMIDNRSDKSHTVKIGDTFTIKPWGFKIVVLPNTYLKSNTLLMDCDAFQNMATVLIQE